MQTDNTNVAGKIVVITGASSGLGEATARHLAERGAAVVLGARRAERLQALVEEITQQGGRASAIVTDVASAAQVQTLVDSAVDAYGRIDVILNNAGVMPHSPLERRKIDDWSRVFVRSCCGLRDQSTGRRGYQRDPLPADAAGAVVTTTIHSNSEITP